MTNHSGSFNFSGYPLDGPVPDLPDNEGGKSRRERVLALARRENLTVRQLYLRVAGARGHWQLLGTPTQIADRLEERFVNPDADGFNIRPPALPDGLIDFIERVVPELHRPANWFAFRAEAAD